MTAASGYSPYCSETQFVAHVDERTVRQLLSDDDSPITGALSLNAKYIALMKAASGQVESSACTGQRYKITSEQNDLASLTGNSAEYLAQMVANLAFWNLWSRRPNRPVSERPTAMAQQALDFLEQLRLGERVFGVQENHEAAALDAVVETSAEVQARNGVVVTSKRFFGTRNRQLHG